MQLRIVEELMPKGDLLQHLISLRPKWVTSMYTTLGLQGRMANYLVVIQSSYEVSRDGYDMPYDFLPYKKIFP